ncbi:MFS transporter [Sabulicella rubraurantiaca]|uniref:MFS transporter n=1 Tax=Sabulicella rubraurantiaca TaxID=2811429 RepID=UPI001A965AAA|nr:MFS transporter [Sabulicella rubraurantiaca]
MSATRTESFETDVPARLDRLPWGRFHWLICIALGVTWILDGLEVTLVGSLAPAIRDSPTLGLTEAQVGLTASAYLAGAVSGALIFGWLADRLGRKRLFTVTLLIYLASTIGTGLSWDFWSFAFFRAMTGAAIGGEYAAINSAIQELIPARRRGTTDLAINGTFWGGAAMGSIASLFLLNPQVVDPDLGWRLAFIIGGGISLIVLWLRRHIPESPRWLMTHGREDEAERIVSRLEAEAEKEHGQLPPPTHGSVRLRRGIRISFGDVWRTMIHDYRSRTVLALTLMASQAFCYNGLFFTYALVLTRYNGVATENVGWYMLPFAVGNLLGPLLLGPLFDSVGRRRMITSTYGTAGLLMAFTAVAFALGWLGAASQTAAWTVIFFFASAAASAAYLTVGESFPLEMRAMGISLFYALGTAIGGIAGPAVFGVLIQSGERVNIMIGYLFGAALMLAAAATAWRLCFAAERQPLELVARPLSSEG